MSDPFEEVFSNLRRGPWASDPNAVPQERMFNDGMTEQLGWLGDGSVTTDVIAAGAVTADKIEANTITANEIAAGTITANEIATNTITSAQIASNAITADEIAANTITAAEIAADTITASEIAASAITASELAADSVTTNKILAANVTSGKIELTISGKNFGANSGTASAPGVYFDVDSSVGMSYTDSGGVRLATGSGMFDPAVVLDPTTSDVVFTQGTNGLLPGSDNAVSIGSSIARYVDVWAVDGTINTSDVRLKKDIADSPLGRDFLRTLRPVVYRWRDTVDTQAREQAGVDPDEWRKSIAPHHRAIERVRREQLAGRMSDQAAERRVAELRGEIAALKERILGSVAAARQARRPGRRLHVGLIAQEVKAALDAAGIDAAFWKQSPTGEQSLAYGELIPVLIRGFQEQDEVIASLLERVAALERA